MSIVNNRTGSTGKIMGEKRTGMGLVKSKSEKTNNLVEEEDFDGKWQQRKRRRFRGRIRSVRSFWVVRLIDYTMVIALSSRLVNCSFL